VVTCLRLRAAVTSDVTDEGKRRGPDLADWLVALLTDPVRSAKAVSAWRERPAKAAEGTADAVASPPALTLQSPYARQQFGRLYSRPWPALFWELLRRQWKLTVRDYPFMFARLVGAVVMAAILGSLFFRTPVSDFSLKIGCVLFAIIHVSFGGGLEVPVVMESRFVVYKQTAAGAYPPSAYVLAYVAANLPVLAGEVLVFSSLLYWLGGFSPDAGRFFFFVLSLFCIALAEGAYFRLIAFIAPRLEVGNMLTGPVVSLQVRGRMWTHAVACPW
jgi:hypothetical protein